MSAKGGNMQWLVSKTKGDMVIWFVVITLSLISALAVYSSTTTMAYRYRAGNTEYYVVKHLFLMAFGFLLMLGAHRVNYKYYSRIAQVMLYASVPLLILTYMYGSSVNDAQRWLKLPGTDLSFQTSDLAKLALIMFVARMLSKRKEVIHEWQQALLPIGGAIVVICGLIFPANFSTSAVLFTTCLALMFIGRVSIKHLGIFTLCCMGLVLLFLAISSLRPGGIGRVKTWTNRIESFTGGGDNLNGKEKDEMNYQSQQANIAIAKGGMFGKGPGNSTQKNFLPYAYADFIFAIIIEEYGFVGALILIILYLLLLYRSITIVAKSPRAFGALLAVGLAFSLVFQAFINMGVAVHIFPVTGLTLPLVSMGGTSLWFTSLAFGIILSISRDIEANEKLEVIAA